MKVLHNIFEIPLGIIKMLTLNILSETNNVLPPILAKALFHSSSMGAISTNNDIIRYASLDYLLEEFEAFFIMFNKNSIQPVTVEISKTCSENLNEIKPLLRFYKKYVGKFEVIVSAKHENSLITRELIHDKNIQETIRIDLINSNLIEKRSGLVEVFDFYYIKSDLFTCGYIIKQMMMSHLTWESAEAIGHYNHLLGKQSIAKNFLLKSIELGSTRVHRVWCSIGLIANRYSIKNKLDYSLLAFSKALNFLEKSKIDKNFRNYERAVILNAKAYSLYRKKEFFNAEKILNESLLLLENTDDIKNKQFKAVVLDNYSMIEFSKKNYDKAKFYSQQALELYHNYHRYHFHRGMIENALHNYHSAINHLNIAKQLSPSNYNIRNLLIDIYEKQNLLIQANEELTQLRDLSENVNLLEDRISINTILLGDSSNLNKIINKYKSAI
jgi:tetratricopeptide (TPR) repeat protein